MRVANRGANNEREIDSETPWMTEPRPSRDASAARPKPNEYERDSFESAPAVRVYSHQPVVQTTGARR